MKIEIQMRFLQNAPLACFTILLLDRVQVSARYKCTNRKICHYFNSPPHMLLIRQKWLINILSSQLNNHNQRMQKKLQIKISQNIAYRIQQYQGNNQISIFLTLFHYNTEVAYVIDLTYEGSQYLPVSLVSEHSFSQIEQKISKQNKLSILKKYVICSCDEINQKIHQFIIVNFNIDGFIGIPAQIVGFSLSYQDKDKNQQKCLTFCNNEEQSLLKNFQRRASQIMSEYNNKYCRTLPDKKNKQNAQFTYAITPFFQFEADVTTAPKFDQKYEPCIKEYKGYSCQYPLLLPIDSQQNKNIAAKIGLYLKQKLATLENINKYTNVPVLSSPRASPNKIFNPHTFIKYANKQKYEIFMVKGMYQYYHYGDQNFSDNGWGCAYRALQTLISWLNMQGYTNPLGNMMSIGQIQQRIDSFDRSRKLKGSSAWIGATEIAWIVPTITFPQINCKILHISDGKQILEKCEEFKNHFLTSGSPIMYGGGEYAYSIVGMHYNWKLGECDFLILDPHYTGEDDYGKIIEKKGLVWRKPQQMFKKGVFYNFCLPLINLN